MASEIIASGLSSVLSTNFVEPTNPFRMLFEDAPVEKPTEESIKRKEQEILKLGELYKKEGKPKELAELIKTTRPFLTLISKAKAGKLIRTLVDMYLDLEAGTGIEIDLCNECIQWANEEKRPFLRQSLEARLIGVYFDTDRFDEALKLSSTLLRELKKLDDKNLLIEVHLVQSKTYNALGNLPRARAALISARTIANEIYCPPKMQAALNLQSGILHAVDEHDYKTAFSYFYEAFEEYDSVKSHKAVMALKYMLLMKIMLDKPDDVQQIVSGKLALKYTGVDIEAMKIIAQASINRSLSDFQSALETYKIELEEDPIVHAHLNILYDKMLEQNLCRIIEPFSRVELEFIAQSIQLSSMHTELKLSQMILDKKLNGILDQNDNVFIVLDEKPSNETHEKILETIHCLSDVVNTLYAQGKKLF